MNFKPNLEYWERMKKECIESLEQMKLKLIYINQEIEYCKENITIQPRDV